MVKLLLHCGEKKNPNKPTQNNKPKLNHHQLSNLKMAGLVPSLALIFARMKKFYYLILLSCEKHFTNQVKSPK